MSKVFVVEGKSDVNKIKSVLPSAQVITTGGFSFGNDLIKELQKLATDNEIILFLDPDFAGDSIRTKIAKQVKNVKHVYTRPEVCQHKSKIGVEHMSREELIKALQNEITYQDKTTADLTYYDLFRLGLTGQNNSKRIRNEISSKLTIRSRNASDFLSKINLLGITYQQLKELTSSVCS